MHLWCIRLHDRTERKLAEKAREDEERRKEERERAKLEAAKRKEMRRLQKAEVRARDTGGDLKTETGGVCSRMGAAFRLQQSS